MVDAAHTKQATEKQQKRLSLKQRRCNITPNKSHVKLS